MTGSIDTLGRLIDEALSNATFVVCVNVYSNTEVNANTTYLVFCLLVRLVNALISLFLARARHARVKVLA